MQRKKKPSERLRACIAEYRQANQESESPVFDFIIGLVWATRAFRNAAQFDGASYRLADYRCRLHVVWLAGAFETFVRGVVVRAGESNDVVLAALASASERKFSLSEIVQFVGREVTVAEIVAFEGSLSNVASVTRLLDPLFHDSDVASEAAQYELRAVHPSVRGSSPSTFAFPEDWRSIVQKLLVTRHAIVHNTSLPCPMRTRDVERLEADILLIVQMLSGLISELSLNRKPTNITITLEDDSTWPTVFGVDDLRSAVWEGT